VSTTLTEGPLTFPEVQRLRELAKVIRSGKTAFLEVGMALVEVQERRLYRARHQTFQAYCREELDISSGHAYALINSARAAARVEASGLPAPRSQAQALAISSLPRDMQAPVWGMAVREAGGQPTGSRVAQLAAHALANPNERTLARMIAHDEMEASRQRAAEEGARQAATEKAKRDRALKSLQRAARHAQEAGWAEEARAVRAILEGVNRPRLAA
jgi:hypothetical protein